MKATGIVRKIDPLGRVVIPKEIRRTNNWNPDDSLEIYTGQDGSVTLKKYVRGCIFCDNASGLVEYNGHHLCGDCAARIIKGVK
jgi:transcriptional pleiotropic regulator of transition state genes